jgi:hypothetical protein
MGLLSLTVPEIVLAAGAQIGQGTKRFLTERDWVRNTRRSAWKRMVFCEVVRLGSIGRAAVSP